MPAKLTPRQMELIAKQWETNTLTAFLCCREAVKHMRTGAQGGRIVNVTARPGLAPEQGVNGVPRVVRFDGLDIRVVDTPVVAKFALAVENEHVSATASLAIGQTIAHAAGKNFELKPRILNEAS